MNKVRHDTVSIHVPQLTKQHDDSAFKDDQPMQELYPELMSVTKS